jgi:high-affinity iron transporter
MAGARHRAHRSDSGLALLTVRYALHVRYGCPTTEELRRRRLVLRRAAWSPVAMLAIGALAWKAVTAPGGVADPTADPSLGHGAVVVNSALLVFREGLEAVLVLAAFTAGLAGANSGLRRPVAAGAAGALAASVATWFLAIGVIGMLGGPGLDVQAGTGLLAVAVLLVVMNWFFHKIYWTGWISAHNRRRRQLVGSSARSRTLLGLALLGFTAVYREGFEVVLFLQNLRLQASSTTVLEGVGLGFAFTVAVGTLTFVLQQRLPYKRMLVATGVLLGFVLLVMVGESVQELQLAGWLPAHGIGVAFPGFLGLWFALFPTLEGIAAQAFAALLVVGSYVVAERVRHRRPRARADAERLLAPEPLAE